MTERRQKYTAEFKRDAVKLVTEQGYAIAEAARNLGLNGNMLGRWKRQLATEGEVAFPGKSRMTLEQEEVQRLRGENRRLRMERDILIWGTLQLI
jgi:transposase